MVFERFTPKPCRSHADRIAVYYETASGLYFCADCRNGLSNATSNELRALAGLKPLDYSAELSPKQLEEEKVRQREEKEREIGQKARLEREATTARLLAEAASKAEVDRVAALDNAEKVRLEALAKERKAAADRVLNPVPTISSSTGTKSENLTTLSDTELKDRIGRETNPSWKAKLVEEQNRREKLKSS